MADRMTGSDKLVAAAATPEPHQMHSGSGLFTAAPKYVRGQGNDSLST